MVQPLQANVSDLHLCQRCPRLLAFYRAGKTNAWKVGFTGGGSGCGIVFHHHIAGAFHSDAAGEKNAKKRNEILDIFKTCATDFESLKRKLFQFSDKNYLEPYLEKNSKKHSSEQIESLYRHTIHWINFLVDFFRNSSGFAENPYDFAAHAFLPTEKLMRAVWVSATGEQLKITGRFDCALFDSSTGEILVAEFKCRGESDATEELVQLALYAWLVRQNNGILPRCTVVYLDESENQTATFSQQEIQSVIDTFPSLFQTALDVIYGAENKGAVIPKTPNSRLCSTCPYTKDCEKQYREPISKETLPKIPQPEVSPPKASDSEADERLKQLVDVLGKYRLAVQPDGYLCGPRFIRLKIMPDAAKGVTVSKIQKKSQDIQVNMALFSPPLIQAQGGFVSVDIPRKKPVTLTINRLIQHGMHTRPDSGAAIPIGAKIDGNTFWIDLAESTTTSILIGGTSGSGKSVLLQSIVIGLVLANLQSRFEFTLIDPKRVTFTKMPLKKLGAELICDQRPALDRLNILVEEMEQRYRLFENNSCHDIIEFNKKTSENLTRHVVVIDEFADLMIDKKMNKELEPVIQRIGQKGRAAGLHLILATQRPEAKVVSPLIKANLQLKIALKVTSVANSKLILDTEGAECLIGNGDMLLGGAVPICRLQGALASKNDYDALRLSPVSFLPEQTSPEADLTGTPPDGAGTGLFSESLK